MELKENTEGKVWYVEYSELIKYMQIAETRGFRPCVWQNFIRNQDDFYETSAILDSFPGFFVVFLAPKVSGELSRSEICRGFVGEFQSESENLSSKENVHPSSENKRCSRADWLRFDHFGPKRNSL